MQPLQQAFCGSPPDCVGTTGNCCDARAHVGEGCNVVVSDDRNVLRNAPPKVDGLAERGNGHQRVRCEHSRRRLVELEQEAHTLCPSRPLVRADMDQAFISHDAIVSQRLDVTTPSLPARP